MDSPGGSFLLLIAQLAERGIVVMINSLLYQSSPSRWFNSGSEEFGQFDHISPWSDSSVASQEAALLEDQVWSDSSVG